MGEFALYIRLGFLLSSLKLLNIDLFSNYIVPQSEEEKIQSHLQELIIISPEFSTFSQVINQTNGFEILVFIQTH